MSGESGSLKKWRPHQRRRARTASRLQPVQRDLRIVWAGIIVAILGWFGSEFGVLYHSGPSNPFAVTGNAIVLVGLILIAVGFSYVVRSVKNMSEASAPMAAPESGTGASYRP